MPAVTEDSFLNELYSSKLPIISNSNKCNYFLYNAFITRRYISLFMILWPGSSGYYQKTGWPDRNYIHHGGEFSKVIIFYQCICGPLILFCCTGSYSTDWCWWASLHELCRFNAVARRYRCVGDDCWQVQFYGKFNFYPINRSHKSNFVASKFEAKGLILCTLTVGNFANCKLKPYIPHCLTQIMTVFFYY